jgi:hypothetical protein
MKNLETQKAQKRLLSAMNRAFLCHVLILLD